MINRFYSIDVNETSFGLTFEDSFDLKCFVVNFHSTEDDPRFGSFQFEPAKHLVSVFIYSDTEDLLPRYDSFDLMESIIGYGLVARFENYELGGTYRAALSYMNDYLERA